MVGDIWGREKLIVDYRANFEKNCRLQGQNCKKTTHMWLIFDADNLALRSLSDWVRKEEGSFSKSLEKMEELKVWEY